MSLDWLETSDGWTPNEDGLTERKFVDAKFLRQLGNVPVNDLVSNAIEEWGRNYKGRGYRGFDVPAVNGYAAILVERFIK